MSYCVQILSEIETLAPKWNSEAPDVHPVSEHTTVPMGTEAAPLGICHSWLSAIKSVEYFRSKNEFQKDRNNNT